MTRIAEPSSPEGLALAQGPEPVSGPWDNAVAESFFSSLKMELVH
jgi:hypothetical protein